ncbi:uncharacterized protein MONBRDRAFT_18559 [Monosiga brevicollis MX1]|uniref:Thioredoxin n=1 Tax=Monosiga brevicollis TaxID=81824 RepID=A9UWC4_MONBE|nr:uncharacterized protein MONBRDRAFT_18559 [Monosiga brevicollis MX1]EDQ90743.1 predicted protein [Monosiga brevicollis MX1]|eukprot:XP_001744794.1 hypothetical protein [Monosiga brevicollis MX1]
MPVIQLNSDAEVAPALQACGEDLVVIDFFATWCGPCQRIAPAVETMSNKYPNVRFFKVDVDVCRETKTAFRIRAMPTFVFVKNTRSIDTLSGADPAALEAKIREHLAGGNGAAAGAPVSDSLVPGQWKLNRFINMQQTEVLNLHEESKAEALAADDSSLVRSDADEQLILSLGLSQPVRIHSLRIKAPADGRAPMTVKLFVNPLATPDFDSVEDASPVQTLTFSPDDVKEGVPKALEFVKFQNVNTLAIFIEDNQGGEDETAFSYLELIGSTRDATNMKDFKRVAGEAGEAHS